MKAIAVLPGKPNSVHLADLPAPTLADVPNGRGVLVRVLRVGVDGTDREINAAEYGVAPDGFEFLVLGHESLGVVEAVGENVVELSPGDHVVAMVRRPGTSLYDLIGSPDLTTDDTYFERGISRRHGFLTERYVDDADYVVKVAPGLGDVGVLLEPLTVVEKAVRAGFETQRRLKVWRPRKALVAGAGTVGLLAAMVLRLKNLDVTVLGRSTRPYLNADLVEALGARYVSTAEASVADAARAHGPFDLVIEATGSSAMAFECLLALAKNGVAVLTSVTGGDRRIEIPADRLNLEFVLGNKAMVGSVNAAREDFEAGAKDLAHAESQWPGWLARLLTHPVKGLETYRELFDRLQSPNGAIKIFCDVAAS